MAIVILEKKSLEEMFVYSVSMLTDKGVEDVNFSIPIRIPPRYRLQLIAKRPYFKKPRRVKRGGDE